jgi:hypothetical protein
MLLAAIIRRNARLRLFTAKRIGVAQLAMQSLNNPAANQEKPC